MFIYNGFENCVQLSCLLRLLHKLCSVITSRYRCRRC